jgi:hypothetical protein
MATKGIAAAGQERIAREIETHFAEAVEARSAQGETKPVAQANALRQLGNAKSARRRFHKRHLTEREEKQIAALQNMATSRNRLALSFSMGFAFIFSVLLANRSNGLLFCIPIFLGSIVLPMLAFRRLSQPANKSKLSSMLLIWSVPATSSLCLVFALIALDIKMPLLIWIRYLMIGVLLIWCAFGILAFQTWQKIRKNENPAIGI